MSTEPRVWIGCLACYNGGRLVGKWIDAAEAGDTTPEDIHDGPTSHEELWCMDHEGFGGLIRGECSPSEASEVAETIERIERDGYPVEAYAAFLDNEGEATAESYENFTESYCGEYDSERDYAECYADDIGAVNEDATWPNAYIDWDRAARDLFCGDHWSARSPEHRIYVFRSY